MDITTVSALGGLALTVLLSAAGWLVAWGSMKTAVKTLVARVEALEAEAGSVAEIRIQIAKVETRLEALFEQFRELNSAIRWMRADAQPGWDGSASATPSRRRGRS